MLRAFTTKKEIICCVCGTKMASKHNYKCRICIKQPICANCWGGMGGHLCPTCRTSTAVTETK